MKPKLYAINCVCILFLWLFACTVLHTMYFAFFVLWNRMIVITFIVVLRKVRTARILFTIKTVILLICKQSPYPIAAKYCLWIKTVIMIINLKIKDSNWDTFFLFSGKYFRTKNWNQVFLLICLKLIWRKVHVSIPHCHLV